MPASNMNHLRCAPWLLLVGVVSVGCPHRNETKPDAASPVGSAPAALESTPLSSADAAVTGDASTDEVPGTRDAGEAASGEEACVDRWLEERGMDRYGSPKGTMYMGGTPLFDERTGEQTDRLVFVYRRHEEARAACRPDGSVPGEPESR